MLDINLIGKFIQFDREKGYLQQEYLQKQGWTL
jgi:hypothetical protein